MQDQRAGYARPRTARRSRRAGRRRRTAPPPARPAPTRMTCPPSARSPMVNVDAAGCDAEGGDGVSLGGEVLFAGEDAGVADLQFAHRVSDAGQPPGERAFSRAGLTATAVLHVCRFAGGVGCRGFPLRDGSPWPRHRLSAAAWDNSRWRDDRRRYSAPGPRDRGGH